MFATLRTRPDRLRGRAGRLVLALLTCGAVGAITNAGVAGAHTPHDVIVDVAVSPDFVGTPVVLAISDNRVLRSTDGGRHFRETVVGLDPEFSMARFGFAPSDPSVVYLSSRGAGVYRSDDAGLHWRSTTGSAGSLNGAELSVSPWSPDVVVVREGLFGGLFRTEDGGRTWATVPSLVGVDALTFVAGRQHRLVAGTASGEILVSDDDGRTFRSPVGLPGDGGAVTAIVDGAGGTLYAGTRAGQVLESEDGGDSWSLRGHLPGAPIQSFALSEHGGGGRTVWASTWHRGAFRSTDGGRTWQGRSRGLTTDEQGDRIRSPQFRAVVVAPVSGDVRLFLAGYDGLFESNDHGARWSEVQTQAEYVSGLAVSPDYRRDRTVVVSTYLKGMYVSRDAGRRFTSASRGLEVAGLSEGNKVLPVRRMHNVVFSPNYRADDQIFTATWTRFVRSDDGGRSWQSIVVAPPPPDTALRQFVIAVSPAYARDHTIMLGTRQGDLYLSTREGDPGTWSTLADLGGWIRSLVISPDFAADGTVFAGTEQGVMRSTDGGRSWEHTGPGGISLVAMSPAYPTDHTVFAGTRDGLVVTRDGGRTWTTTGLGPRTPARGVAAVSVSPDYERDHTVLASIDGTGLNRSRDGGRTFQPVGADLQRRGLVIADFDRPTSAPIQFSPSFAEDRTVFAFAQESVLRSTDGGAHWRELAIPPASEYGSRAPAEPGSSGDVPWVVLGVAVLLAGGVGLALVVRHRRRAQAGD